MISNCVGIKNHFMFFIFICYTFVYFIANALVGAVCLNADSMDYIVFNGYFVQSPKWIFLKVGFGLYMVVCLLAAIYIRYCITQHIDSNPHPKLQTWSND